MYAVIETGGKQIKVAPGDRVRVEKLDTPAGENIQMREVLVLAGEGIGVAIGTPYVPEAVIDGKVIRHARNKKVTIMRYKPKKRIRVKNGYRQEYTLLEIREIRHKDEVVGKMEARAPKAPAPPKEKKQLRKAAPQKLKAQTKKAAVPKKTAPAKKAEEKKKKS
jgi:large subunit ribosomal protein L21